MSELNFLSAFSKERIEKREELFVKLYPILNEIHGVNYSLRFWKILLINYVSAAISDLNFLKDNKILIKPLFEVIGNSVHHRTEEKIMFYIRYLLKSTNIFIKFRKFKAQIKSNSNIGMGFACDTCLPETIETYILPYYYYCKYHEKDINKRNKIYQISDKFNDEFFKNVINLIPEMYIEYFDIIMEKIPLYEPNNKVIHTSFMESGFVRFLVAKYVENGAKLYYYQHGANYGEFKYHSAYQFEYSVADKYFTWGWKINERDEPSSAFRLEHFKNYYLATDIRSNDCLIVFGNVTPRNYQKYKFNGLYLIENLDRTKYKIIVARPRKTGNKFNSKSDLDFLKNNNIIIDSGKRSKIIELVNKSKIIIQMNYPSTNALECFYVDHPTVCLLDNDNPTDIAKYYYNYLIDMKVMYNNIESLTKFLNNLKISEWWSGVIANQKYQEFKNTFLKRV